MGRLITTIQTVIAAMFFAVAVYFASVDDMRCALLSFAACLAWVVVAIQQVEINQRDRLLDSCKETDDRLDLAYAKIDMLTELIQKQKRYERKTTTVQNKQINSKNRQYEKESDKSGNDGRGGSV